MPTILWENDARTEFVKQPDWKTTDSRRLYLNISRDSNGTFSAVVVNLPGTGSCGDTEEEAIANAMEAARAAIDLYEDDNEEVPWADPALAEIPFGTKRKVVILDA